MIVVEGVDLTGKTTLVKAIAERFNMKIEALGRPKAKVRHWTQAQARIIQPDLGPTIFDRLVIGSMIYGNYLNDEFNYKPVTPRELQLFLDQLAGVNGLIIWARCDVEQLRLRYARRGDPYLSLAQIEDIHALYEKLMYNIQNSYPYFLRYDSTKWATSRWVEAYSDELKEHSR